MRLSQNLCERYYLLLHENSLDMEKIKEAYLMKLSIVTPDEK